MYICSQKTWLQEGRIITWIWLKTQYYCLLIKFGIIIKIHKKDTRIQISKLLVQDYTKRKLYNVNTNLGLKNTSKSTSTHTGCYRMDHGLMRITSILGCLEGKQFKCSIIVCTWDQFWKIFNNNEKQHSYCSQNNGEIDLL